MEENKNVSKNGWKRIFGKKWFFPAVYLTMAALLLTGVLWYQNLENQVPEANDESETDIGSDVIDNAHDFDQDSEAVVSQQEVLKMPVAEEFQTEIVTKFYDYSADSKDQEKALVLYNNKYYQSNGLDIASAEDESFDVMASLSGTVTEVKEDPLLGNVIKMEHDNDLETYYASLGDVLVEQGAKVKQGDTIGNAGRNLFGQASGTHVHFELRKAGEPVNPEQYFNQSVTEVTEPSSDQVESDKKQDEATDESSEDSSTEEQDGATNESSEDGSTEEQGESTNDQSDDGSKEEDKPEEDGAAEEGNTTNNTESSAAMANA